MEYLHTMIRVKDLDASLDFYCNKLGLKQVRRRDIEAGRFTLVFLAPEGQEDAQRIGIGVTGWAIWGLVFSIFFGLPNFAAAA